MSGVRIPSLTPLKPQVRRPGRDRGRAVQHDHRPSLGADLRISAAHGGDFWEPILRPTLRGQPELLTGRWVKEPGAAGTLSSGPRICLIDRPLRRLRPAATGRPSPELKGGTDVADHGAVTLHTDRDAPSVCAGSAAGQRQSVIVGRARATEGAQAGVVCYGESGQPASASSRVTQNAESARLD